MGSDMFNFHPAFQLFNYPYPRSYSQGQVKDLFPINITLIADVMLTHNVINLMFLASIIIHTLLGSALSYSNASAECSEWIQSVIASKFTSLPNYTILYSGLATNNPGQKQECQLTTFNYFLIYTETPAPNLTSFTGICLPQICSADDVRDEISTYMVATTFDYGSRTLDGLAWVGVVVFFVYVAVVAAVMMVNSFRDEKTEEKEETRIEINTSVNDKQSLLESTFTKPIFEKPPKGAILRVFDCYNHYCKIFEPQTKRNVLSGLRVMSLFMIIVATEFSFRQNLAQNDAQASTLLNGGVGYIIANVEFAYSVWLFAAGLTAAYALYKVDTFKEMFKGILMKFLRVWPYLLVFTLVVYGLTEAVVADPLVKVWQAMYTKDCPSTFWRKWFLINPLIQDNTVCMPWTWLLESQLLLYTLVPIFIVITKSRKWLGYALLITMSIISILFAAFFLNHKNIEFYPAVLFNNSNEYVLQFQMNTLVQSSSFVVGLLFGMVFVNALDKIEGEGSRGREYVFGKLVKKSPILQYVLQVVGVAMMSLAFWFIVPTIDNPKSGFTRFFLSTTPTIFAIGLGLLITPSILGGTSLLTNFLNTFLGGSFWAPIDRMAVSIYLLAPIVIGTMTFSLQTSLYYAYEYVFLLLIGDVTLVMLVSMLVAPTLEMTVVEGQKEIQYRVFGMTTRESVVVVEES